MTGHYGRRPKNRAKGVKKKLPGYKGLAVDIIISALKCNDREFLESEKCGRWCRTLGLSPHWVRKAAMNNN